MGNVLSVYLIQEFMVPCLCASGWVPFKTTVSVAGPRWPTWQTSSGYLVWELFMWPQIETGSSGWGTFLPSLLDPDWKGSLLLDSSNLLFPVKAVLCRRHRDSRQPQQQPGGHCRSNSVLYLLSNNIHCTDSPCKHATQVIVILSVLIKTKDCPEILMC